MADRLLGPAGPLHVQQPDRTVENYLGAFFGRVGGSPWAGVQTQYCQNIDPGFSCAGQPYAQYVTNPTRQLRGAWVDPAPVPAEIVTTALAENATTDPIAAEAIRAAQHFGYDVNATYFILTPPGHGASAYGSVYCAYHSETGHTTGHGVRYAFVPYVPEQGAGCGANSVNQNDAFGNGYLERLRHRRRARIRRGGHRSRQSARDPGRMERRPDQRERRQVRLDRAPGHLARQPPVRDPASVEQ